MNLQESVLVSVRDVEKVYRLAGETVYALKGINLDINRGEYLAIMGPSGSGKTTLFNMIGALDKPSAGKVLVGEVNLPSLSSLELAYFRCKHIGYVFQNYNLIASLSALENVALPLIFLGQDIPDAHRRAEEVLDYVGLADRVLHRPDELSGGQQQRVAIARALANDPAILLADEPTANLDINTGQAVIDIFSRLVTEQGVTVISATHDHKMLAASDRIVWIDQGEVDRVEQVADMSINVGSIGGE